MQPDVPTAHDEYVIDDFVVSEGDEHAPLVHSSRVDVDVQNIITGKRKRRATRTIYDEPEFACALADQMMSDIPESERDAALWDECDDAVIDTDDEPEHSSEDETSGDEPVSPSPSMPQPAEAVPQRTVSPGTPKADRLPEASDDEDYNPSGSGSDSDGALDDASE